MCIIGNTRKELELFNVKSGILLQSGEQDNSDSPINTSLLAKSNYAGV